MIFPFLELEPTIQVNDRTRLSALKSFVTQDEAAISLVQIDPDGSTGLITVTSDQFLDWQYAASGTYTVTCRVTASGASAAFTDTVTVLSVAADKLFSTDADLKLHEPDILEWIAEGRNTFLNVHRRAQKMIMEYIRREGFRDTDGDVFTKAAFVDIEEVKQWSTFLSLRLIFEGISNAIDDVFSDKAKRYKGLEVTWRKTVLLGMDVDGDGVVDDSEGIDNASTFVARR